MNTNEGYYLICGFIAVILNLYVLVVVKYSVKTVMGIYRKLLVIFCGYQILYVIAHCSILPGFIGFQEGFIVHCDRQFCANDAYGFYAYLYIAFYVGTIVYLMIMVIYRYAVIHGKQQVLRSFETIWGKLAWTLAFFTVVGLYILTKRYIFSDEYDIPYTKGYFAKVGLNPKKIGYFAFMTRKIDFNGTESYRPLRLFLTCIIVTFYLTSFFIIVFCGLSIGIRLRSLNLSLSSRKTQMKLFKVLCAQTMIPVWFCFVPCIFIHLLPLMGYVRFPEMATRLFILFPIFYAIATIFLVEEYRRTTIELFKFLFCFERTNTVNVSKTVFTFL